MKTKALLHLHRLGEQVRKRREDQNMSQQKLANQAKVHTNVVGRIERGLCNPTLLTLIAIATALDTTVDQLL